MVNKNPLEVTEQLEQLVEDILREVKGLRQFPLIIGVYSERPEHRRALDYFKDCLKERFARALKSREIPEIPIIRIGLEPIVPYSLDLGFYLKSQRKLEQGPKIPEGGKEVHYPQPVEDRILGYILNGSVIDHIRAGRVWKLIEPLGLENFAQDVCVSIGTNCNSKKLGKKDVLKMQGKELNSRECNLVSAYVERCTISLIRTGKVYRKLEVSTPEVLDGVLLCPREDCSGNKIHYFSVEKKFSCDSCGYSFRREELRAAI